MAFKIIEGLFAIVALIKRFAGGASKFTDAAGVVGVAERALYCFVWSKEIVAANSVRISGRCNTVGFQFLLTGFCHPLRGPCRV